MQLLQNRRHHQFLPEHHLAGSVDEADNGTRTQDTDGTRGTRERVRCPVCCCAREARGSGQAYVAVRGVDYGIYDGRGSDDRYDAVKVRIGHGRNRPTR